MSYPLALSSSQVVVPVDIASCILVPLIAQTRWSAASCYDVPLSMGQRISSTEPALPHPGVMKLPAWWNLVKGLRFPKFHAFNLPHWPTAEVWPTNLGAFFQALGSLILEVTAGVGYFYARSLWSTPRCHFRICSHTWPDVVRRAIWDPNLVINAHTSCL